jgi:hypothetical protein
MIEKIDDELILWVKQALGQDVTPTLAPPADSQTSSVSLYLLEVVNNPFPRSGANYPYQPTLRYLVTTHAQDPRKAHRLLAALLYAAFKKPEYEVELEPIPHDLWAAFHIAPRPAFILRAQLPHQEKGQPAQLVRQPEPVMDSSAPVVPMYGLVLGPGDVPLMNARVELPNLFRSATTDHRGRFTLAGVPAAPKKKTLIIKARRQEKIIQIQRTGTPDEPEVIHLDLIESEGGN